MSLSLTDEKEAGRLFDALAKGGEVQMPLAKTFWSPCFGMVKDPFGLPWMLNVLE
jgi:PhnB protein